MVLGLEASSGQTLDVLPFRRPARSSIRLIVPQDTSRESMQEAAHLRQTATMIENAARGVLTEDPLVRRNWDNIAQIVAGFDAFRDVVAPNIAGFARNARLDKTNPLFVDASCAFYYHALLFSDSGKQNTLADRMEKQLTTFEAENDLVRKADALQHIPYMDPDSPKGRSIIQLLVAPASRSNMDRLEVLVSEYEKGADKLDEVFFRATEGLLSKKRKPHAVEKRRSRILRARLAKMDAEAPEYYRGRLTKENWVQGAKCRSTEDPAIFFLPGAVQNEVALFCRGCQAREFCIEDAAIDADLHGVNGVWGGLTERDRRGT